MVEQDVSELTQAVWVNHRGATQWSRTQLSQAWRRLTADVGGGCKEEQQQKGNKRKPKGPFVLWWIGTMQQGCSGGLSKTRPNGLDRSAS